MKNKLNLNNLNFDNLDIKRYHIYNNYEKGKKPNIEINFDNLNIKREKKWNYKPSYNRKINIIEIKLIDNLKIIIKVRKKKEYIFDIEKEKKSFRERHKSEILK